MVTVIHVTRSLRRSLYYNEQKVKAGHARLLAAGYYPMDAVDLTFRQKLTRLEKLTELNQCTKLNSVHISLNFDPSDKLSGRQLIEISELYLEKIGFGGQPYLLYQHFDAGHPHVHLVTTHIRPDGTAIPMHGLPQNQSQKARREIEVLYNLVRAEDSERRKLLQLAPARSERLIYGRMETAKAIDGVLRHVLKNYKFSSLTELNGLLSLYNLMADPGSERSRLRKYEGLRYRVLDSRGIRVGRAVKASDLLGKPTLKVIRGMFPGNQAAKVPLSGRVRNAVDLALLHEDVSLQGLRDVLQKKGIDLALRPDALIYIDHIQKVVFTDSELGACYSLEAVLKRSTNPVLYRQNVNSIVDPGSLKPAEHEEPVNRHIGPREPGETKIITPGMLTAVLLDPGYQPEVSDWQFRRRRKKRKRQTIAPE